VTPLDDLLKQARWLRFRDGALERQFQGERQADGLMRSRVTMVVAMFFVASSGWRTALRMGWQLPEPVNWELHYRFFATTPWWLLLLLASFLPDHRRRVNWMNGTVTVGVLWGLFMMRVGPRSITSEIVTLLTADFTMVLLASVFALPMRFGTLVAAAVAAAGGSLAWLHVFLWTSMGGAPSVGSAAAVLTANFSLVALVAVTVGWGRERNDRVMFAQREHVRRLAEQLEKNNAELARLNAEKNEFMAVAAHDLRAPLGVVRGLLELVRDGKVATEEKRAEAVRQALGEAQRMHTLVNDYLGAHALESGTVPVRQERLDLGAAAVAAGVRHAGAAERKGQRIAVEAPTGKVWVTADAGMLAQVADNFVTNALKFSAEGATVKIELLTAETDGGGVARLMVTDEGPGIAAEEQGRLFAKFGKGSARATAGEASTGLGLAVAKRLAEAMGGAVGCESPANERGTGATFWVEVALAGGRARAEI
jgi:signal transduction histidine kinase